ncbi:TPA: type IVB secretion system protein DotA [Legionella pneumophila]|nr:type IVB secretion system protein DotA [Legionella pneumophila]HDQ4393466.1 type IVB secretion system protein DotA [Legionella pneumophila]
MNKLAITVLLCFFPALALAESGALSFAPPASDLSVVFLGNLFGVVDGVLHGTGSQIMGNMFGVFNSAVLALGGIIIMYTLMVSTMNTAHEGQMLGQKWSSIWIPLRSTFGLALLIPKASGYCMMQVFFMWVIVQGVGAADKIWEAALSYLNRGGVIIQAQSDPTKSLTDKGGKSTGIAKGAFTILSGQVCMLGLQKQLQTQRNLYLSQSNSPPCGGNPTPEMNTFCRTAIPDFISTVNFVKKQSDDKSKGPFSLDMPNFDKSSPFYFLNGICGTVTWNSISDLKADMGNNIKLTSSQLETAQLSRAIAIQQMYVTLSTVAQVMVNNDPAFSSTSSTGNSKNDFSAIAKQQFGVPYKASGQVCTEYQQVCQTWGSIPSSTGSTPGVLFNGTEFLGAINDYNGIMTPTINLLKQAKSSEYDNKSRDFIQEANTKGWIMAGSYFFDLVKLNGSAVKDDADFDSDTGLDNSNFDPAQLTKPFGKTCQGTYALLCNWFQNKSDKLVQVQSLINGAPALSQDGVKQPDLSPDPKRAYVEGPLSSTVYGFINNSMMVQLPGQPGIKPLTFANLINFKVDTSLYYMKHQDFDCGRVKILFFSFCLGRMMGDLFYNYVFRYVYNFFLAIFGEMINSIVMAFLMIPLQGMKDIFIVGVQTLAQPGVNPIVALANMGTMYINFSGTLWLTLLNMAVVSSLIPLFGIFIFALIMMAMPLLMAWIGTMVSIGFVTAYYIPVLPYMIFTFGSFAWLIAVIEAMVAAPIVALGVTHPEGNEAFGKGEFAIMILVNVFLRPSLMIIGYITAIALSYVGVWILNAGFDHAISYIQSDQGIETWKKGDFADKNANSAYCQMYPADCKMIQAGQTVANWTGSKIDTSQWDDFGSKLSGDYQSTALQGGYSGWAGVYAFFFSILIYTTMYLIIVQKAFTLIAHLPDKVLRWIGGSPESFGQETMQWGEEAKGKVEKAGEATYGAEKAIGDKLGAKGQEMLGKLGPQAKKVSENAGDVSGKGKNSGSQTGPSSKPDTGQQLGGSDSGPPTSTPPPE